MENLFSHEEIKSVQATFMTKVYGWMAAALVLTGAVAFYVANNPALVQLIIGNKLVFYGCLFGELGLVIWLSTAINRMAANTATLMFFLYALLNGVTLSTIFLVYTADSIAGAFFISGGMFTAMASYGYFTKRDLSGWGSMLIMALIGIIIASVVNMFIKNDMFQFVISCIGVLIFVGLTAYDVQKIKTYASSAATSGDAAQKGAIMGALTLYLDFINLFLYILRIFGRRK